MNPSVIRPLEPASPLRSVDPLKRAEKKNDGFAKLVGGFVKDVNTLQDNAADQVAKLAAGKVDNIHQVMIAIGKAEISFDYMMEIRNKLIEAYREIMRMPV